MEKEIKVLFYGTPEFAAYILKHLVENQVNIVGVVTAPNKPAGRGKEIKQSEVKIVANELGIPVYQPLKLKSPEFSQLLNEINPDLQWVVAFRMLPEMVWDLPKLGTWNLHGSILPQYRGAAPINWAIINGEIETGVTTFKLKHEIDTGEILESAKIEIDPEVTFGELYDKLKVLGAQVSLSSIRKIALGNLNLTAQDSDLVIKHAPKLNKENTKLNWNNTNIYQKNFIRGLNPIPAAWTTLNEETLKIYNTGELNYNLDMEIGGLLITKKQIWVQCQNGQLEITELQLQGKKRMDARSFINGLRGFENLVLI